MTSRSHILALDQGTTSSRAIVFNQHGGIVACAQHEFEQLFPRPGWVEHDPDAIWQSQLRAAREALAQADLTADRIAGLGITNQRETTLIWDRRTGEPIANAIVWQDRRTADVCDRLRDAGLAETFQRKTGLVLDAYFSGTKIHWLLQHVDGARERAQRGELAFGTVDSWLVWKLTAGRVHVTDATNASRTLLYDIHRGQWDDDLLKHLDVPRELLPDVRPCSEVYGETEADLLGAAVPIAGLAGDQQAALFGQMCMKPGMAKNTYGTGCFMLLNTGDTPRRSNHNLLTTIAWQLGDEVEYALEGSIFIGGAVVQWLRDGLRLIETSAEVEKLAETVSDNGGVYFVPAFAGLGAPHWDPHARGTVVGLTRGTTAGHLARAALEAIAYQTADVLDAMHADAGLPVTELRVDGGAATDDLLMQFQADVLGVPTVRPKVTETTAAGAAYLAGLAVGLWQDREQIAGQWQVDRRFEPSMPPEQVRKLRARWLEAVERSRGWAQ